MVSRGKDDWQGTTLMNDNMLSKWRDHDEHVGLVLAKPKTGSSPLECALP